MMWMGIGREVVGWLLIAISLYVARIAVLFVSDVEEPRIIEAGVLAFVALGVLRAGVALVRLSVAQRLSHELAANRK